MEKKTVIAVILSVLIIVLWQLFYIQPKVEKQKELMREQQIALMKQKAEEDKKLVETKKEKPAKVEETKPVLKKAVSVPKTTVEQSQYIVTVKNKYYTAKISNVGARIFSWTLNDYKGDDGAQLELVDAKMRNLGYQPLSIYCQDNGKLADSINHALFTSNNSLSNNIVNLRPGSKEIYRLEMEYSDGKENAIKKVLEFDSESYVVGLTIEASGRIAEEGFIQIGPGLENRTGSNSTSLAGMNPFQIVVGLPEGKADRISKIDKTAIFPSDTINFIGIETLYFAELFTAADDEPIKSPLMIKAWNKSFDKTQKEYAMAVGIKIEENLKLGIFMGPKEFSLANQLGYTNLVDFGFWSFLALPLFFLLKWLNSFFGNYGISIIVMTILINLAFYPLRQKSFKSMQKMKDLQPKMNAIKSKYEKYKKDMEKRQQMNQEIMALYKAEGVSPTGGCLPLLIQFPFLIAIYRMLAVAIELRHAPFFLWIQDLSVKDPYYITPIVMGVTMWYQNRLTPTTAAADQTTAKMMKFLPILFTLMFLNFPSGLVLYWLFNNLFAIGQQYLTLNKNKKKN
jgi:YidC/Oxa1 family membrane protein insertase